MSQSSIEASAAGAVPVLTVDGPSGAGKGTVSQAVVRELGWHFLDSGALYRLTGLYCLRQGVDPVNAEVVAALAAALPADFRVDDDGEHVLLDGEDVGREIRTEEVGGLASRVAAIPEVRQALLERQRSFRRPPGLVADGRDMGTVVFPDAPAKVFLTASPEERAKRRYNQLKGLGGSVSLADLSREIAERDERDASRATAPLKPAPDAEFIDTTDMSIDAVVERVVRYVRDRIGISG